MESWAGHRRPRPVPRLRRSHGRCSSDSLPGRAPGPTGKILRETFPLGDEKGHARCGRARTRKNGHSGNPRADGHRYRWLFENWHPTVRRRNSPGYHLRRLWRTFPQKPKCPERNRAVGLPAGTGARFAFLHRSHPEGSPDERPGGYQAPGEDHQRRAGKGDPPRTARSGLPVHGLPPRETRRNFRRALDDGKHPGLFRGRRDDLYSPYRLARTQEDRQRVIPDMQRFNMEARKYRGVIPAITTTSIKQAALQKPREAIYGLPVRTHWLSI